MLKFCAAIDILTMILVGMMFVTRISSGENVGFGAVYLVILLLLTAGLIFLIKRIKRE